jgi:predicted nuclease of restriction endonuclease-like RecB superfamily
MKGGYRIEIEGPYALFQQVTKYGLQLALLLPILDAVGPWTLTATILWGPQRTPRTLTLEGGGDAATLPKDRLPDELARLKKAFVKLDSGWTLRRATKILALPGVGLCVPDFTFKHPERGVVHLELLGYWSREAVWKRVDLIEGGLKDRVVFAVSSRLRVGEDVLGDEQPGALYVFKGALSAKEVLKRLERVAASG